MLSKAASSTIFKVIGMTRTGIEPRSPGQLVNTLPTRRNRIIFKDTINVFLKFCKKQGDFLATETESLLHSLEKATGYISHSVNANKTKCMCLNREEAIYNIICSPLKLVDQFMYLGSGISFTENDVNIRPAKVWTAIERISII